MKTEGLVRAVRFTILVPVLLLVGGGLVLSQEPAGEIRGTLHDASGAIVTVAVVVIQNQDTGWSMQGTVNAKGEFVFQPLPPGTYRVEVLSPGFKRYGRRGIRLHALKTVTVTAKLEPGSVKEVLAGLGGGHVVLGYGWNDYGYGSWSHTFAVMVTPGGRVVGRVKVSLFEPETPDFPGLSIKYTNDIECFELDAATGSAWLGGRVSETSNPDFLSLATYVVDFARDGGPGNSEDAHGDTVPAWFGEPETCHARPGPLFMDPVQRGNIVVR